MGNALVEDKIAARCISASIQLINHRMRHQSPFNNNSTPKQPVEIHKQTTASQRC